MGITSSEYRTCSFLELMRDDILLSDTPFKGVKVSEVKERVFNRL